MKRIYIFFLLISIVACSKTKEQIADKCLQQANQTFGNHWVPREEFFNNCMAENKHYWNDKQCPDYESSSPAERLSSRCYK